MFFYAMLIISTVMLAGCDMADSTSTKDKKTDRKKILLVGASVGKSWDLPGLPKRVNSESFDLESVAAWQFDKSEALEEVLMRPKRKFRFTRTYLKGFFQPAPQRPDVIIIKECSAYFPGDQNLYKDLIRRWVKRIREANIEVALATVVPVTRGRSETRKGQIEDIRAFNDWILEYAGKEQIRLLDLEAALRTDASGRFLIDDFSTDGAHLNRKAYDLLDGVLLAAF